MAAEEERASSTRERPRMSAGQHGRRILEARDDRKRLSGYQIAGMLPFADGFEPAAIAEDILAEVFGLVSVLGLAFDDAVYAQTYHPNGSSELMQGTPLQHARAMGAIGRLVALAGFYASEAQQVPA